MYLVWILLLWVLLRHFVIAFELDILAFFIPFLD